MQERYLRNLPALSKEECEALLKKRVCVVGCGGLGGYIIELLARVGIGYIKAVDGDVFEVSNLNRQLLSKTDTLGKSKAETAKIRVSEINPDVDVQAVCEFLSEDNAEEIISGCDAVFDALDNIPSRKILAKACKKAGVPYIYGAIEGWCAQAAVIMPENDVISMLYPEGAELKSKSSLSFIPAFCAAIQVSLGVKILAGRKTETGKLYYFDLLELDIEEIMMGQSL